VVPIASFRECHSRRPMMRLGWLEAGAGFVVR
jgi:hypothetical protein